MSALGRHLVLSLPWVVIPAMITPSDARAGPKPVESRLSRGLYERLLWWLVEPGDGRHVRRTMEKMATGPCVVAELVRGYSYGLTVGGAALLVTGSR